MLLFWLMVCDGSANRIALTKYIVRILRKLISVSVT